MVGRQLPLLSLLLPFYLVALMAGWRGLKDVWPAALVSGGTFAVVQFLTSNLLGPMLPDILSSTASIVALVLLLRRWHPARSFRFAHEPPAAPRPSPPAARDAIRAWTPFVLLTLLVSDWGVRSVQAVMDRVTVLVPMPLLHEAIVNPDTGAHLAAVYRVNWIGASGTSVFLAAVVSAVALRVTPAAFAGICKATVRQLAVPVATIASFLAFAYVGSASGMTTTLGRALAETGGAFPFFSPVLGWLGVFITGSDTASNALFGKLQQVSAGALGVNPVLTVAANSTGGVAGKMISPQSIAVACAATGLVGREPELLRFTLRHSLLMVGVVGGLTWLQATWLNWMIPAAVAPAVSAAMPASPAGAVWILGASGLTILLLVTWTRRRTSAREEGR